MRQYVLHTVQTDKHPIYGDGFRAAQQAYNAVGLAALLQHLRTTPQAFPQADADTQQAQQQGSYELSADASGDLLGVPDDGSAMQWHGESAFPSQC